MSAPKPSSCCSASPRARARLLAPSKKRLTFVLMTKAEVAQPPGSLLLRRTTTTTRRASCSRPRPDGPANVRS